MGSNVVVLAATAIVLCSFLIATDAARAPSKCKKEGCTVDVIVAGAGLAGLTAARNLARAGKRVVVLEARKRVGGRCFRDKWTAPNGDVVWYDRGGQWVGPTQFSMLSMIKEYNATTYDSRHLKGQGMVTYGGEQAKMPASYLAGLPDAPMLSATWGLSSTMLENMNASDTMLAALAEISASINITHPWDTEGAKTLDSTTGLQWVEENYDNDFVTFMLEFIVNSQGSLGGQEAWATSLLHIARQLATGPLAEIPEKWLVNGAMGQFPAYIQAEIEKLGGSVFINSQVLRIEQDDKGVMVKTTKGYFKAKYLIVAMPPHLSAKMVYSPPLPILRDHLTQRMPMGLVTKLIGIYDKPFWVSDPTSNDLSRQVTYGIGDHPTTAETFDVSPPNGYGVIAGFLDSHHVVEYGGDIEMIKNLTLKDWAATWGPGAMNPLDFVAVEWAADPWTGGAYMSFATPGTWTLLGEGLTKPFGRVHWAGTETANKWPGYLDGAISSGEDAAEKILKLLK